MQVVAYFVMTMVMLMNLSILFFTDNKEGFVDF